MTTSPDPAVITEPARDDLLDAEQIAHELGVNVKLVRRWQATGQLRSARLGDRRRTRRAWLEQFIDDRATRAAGDGDD
jgi:hypothetical protein